MCGIMKVGQYILIAISTVLLFLASCSEQEEDKASATEMGLFKSLAVCSGCQPRLFKTCKVTSCDVAQKEGRLKSEIEMLPTGVKARYFDNFSKRFDNFSKKYTEFYKKQDLLVVILDNLLAGSIRYVFQSVSNKNAGKKIKIRAMKKIERMYKNYDFSQYRRYKNKQNILHFVVYADDYGIVKKWVEKYPGLLNGADKNGVTPISRAMKSGAVKSVKALLNAGANVQDERYWRACNRFSDLHEAAQKICDVLLEHQKIK